MTLIGAGVGLLDSCQVGEKISSISSTLTFFHWSCKYIKRLLMTTNGWHHTVASNNLISITRQWVCARAECFRDKNRGYGFHMQLMRDYHFKHVECEGCLIQGGNPPHLISHPSRYTSIHTPRVILNVLHVIYIPYFFMCHFPLQQKNCRQPKI